MFSDSVELVQQSQALYIDERSDKIKALLMSYLNPILRISVDEWFIHVH